MGSYTFQWELPADEVYVTGTFDDWTKSEKLDHIGDVFKKSVFFKDASKKIYFKYVVDGVWVVNESSPKEADHEGNVNNFIAPEDMTSEEPAAPVIQTVTAESTTAALAGEQPIEKKEETEATPSEVPGFPEIPSGDLDQTFSVNPLPAAPGAVNPFHLAPGEPVPSFNAQDLNANVKLDEASYENSDALPGIEASELQPPSFDANVVPESGLPVAGATAAFINSVGPSTLDMAANVPLEAKVPQVVKESQQEAGFPPEASAIPEEVQEKAQVEEELKSKVPEVPAETDSTPAATAEAPEQDAGVVAEDTPAEHAAPVADEAPVVAAVVPDQEKTEATPEIPQEAKEAVPEPSTEAAASTSATEEKKEAEPEVAEEVKQEEVKPVEATPAEVKTEEVAPAPVVTEAPQPEVEKTEAPVPEVLETPAPVAEPVAEPADKPAEPVATEAPAVESAEPESAAVTQVDDSAEAAAPAAERPHVDIPATETPKSERTEVSPTAEAPQADAQANGEEKSGQTPSDKKRKNRLSTYLARLKSKIF